MHQLTELLLFSLQQQASDLHFAGDQNLMLRIDGKLIVYPQYYCEQNTLETQLLSLLTHGQKEKLQQNKQIDFALNIPQIGRFRVNIFYRLNGISAVFRCIANTILLLEELQVPSILYELICRQSGLILITGSTGSGKSTTLAAIIQYLNQTTSAHIITLEDPIEFVHISKNCLIQQREIDEHIDSFDNALISALRQDPDIILLGELRKPDTIRLALTAAETGHLVLATLHTRSAIESIERIIDIFSSEERAFVCTQLSKSLLAIVSQQLLAKKGGGRLAIFELLNNTPAVSNLIREGKTHQLYTVLQMGSGYGMQTMEMAKQKRLVELL